MFSSRRCRGGEGVLLVLALRILALLSLCVGNACAELVHIIPTFDPVQQGGQEQGGGAVATFDAKISTHLDWPFKLGSVQLQVTVSPSSPTPNQYQEFSADPIVGVRICDSSGVGQGFCAELVVFEGLQVGCDEVWQLALVGRLECRYTGDVSRDAVDPWCMEEVAAAYSKAIIDSPAPDWVTIDPSSELLFGVVEFMNPHCGEEQGDKQAYGHLRYDDGPLTGFAPYDTAEFTFDLVGAGGGVEGYAFDYCELICSLGKAQGLAYNCWKDLNATAPMRFEASGINTVSTFFNVSMPSVLEQTIESHHVSCLLTVGAQLDTGISAQSVAINSQGLRGRRRLIRAEGSISSLSLTLHNDMKYYYGGRADLKKSVQDTWKDRLFGGGSPRHSLPTVILAAAVSMCAMLSFVIPV